MGLAGRKVKQRIGHDPRNLTWSDDAARFGAAYLQKFGWTSGTGVGVEGDGRASHVKVAQKLDMLGIGAAHQRDPNGLAWKQNRDFERLLERLNGGASGDAEGMKVDGFVRPTEEGEEEEEGGEDVQAETKKKRKKAKDGEGEGKKKRKTSPEVSLEVEETVVAESTTPPTPAPSAHVGPPRGHRARFIRSKRMALTDAAAVAAVLGIAPSASTSQDTSAFPSAPASGADTPTQGLLEPLEKLTTSSTSVMDYFKQKLLAKASRLNTPAGADDNAPRTGLGASRLRPVAVEDDEDAPRMGLGAALRAQQIDEEDSAPRRGLGAPSFASALGFTPSLASSFLLPAPITPEDTTTDEKAAKKAAKRARKEAKRAQPASVEQPSTPAAPLEPEPESAGEAVVEDDEEARKAAKRARKEARRKAKADATEANETMDASPTPHLKPGPTPVGEEDDEVVKKAAKRARKEARRLEKATAGESEEGKKGKKRRRAETEE